MAEQHEMKHPTGNFTVKVDAERRGVFLARGYRDVGAGYAPTFPGSLEVPGGQRFTGTSGNIPLAKPKAVAKPKPKPAPKPVRRTTKK